MSDELELEPPLFLGSQMKVGERENQRKRAEQEKRRAGEGRPGGSHTQENEDEGDSQKEQTE